MNPLTELYQNNEDFRNFVDKFVWCHPEYSVDEALTHQIVKDIANYYMEEKTDERLFFC